MSTVDVKTLPARPMRWRLSPVSPAGSEWACTFRIHLPEGSADRPSPTLPDEGWITIPQEGEER